MENQINMKWNYHESQKLTASIAGFLKALQIWIKKPHVLNRRLCGSSVKLVFNVDSLQTRDIQTYLGHKLNEIQEYFSGHIKPDKIHNRMLLKDLIVKIFNLETDPCFIESKDEKERQPKNESGTHFLHHNIPLQEVKFILRSLLPKQTERCPELMELVIYDGNLQQVFFLPLIQSLNEWKDNSISDCPIYSFLLKEDAKCVELWSFGGSDDCQSSMTAGCSLPWVQAQLFPRLCKWSIEAGLNTEETSLRLVSIQKYNEYYQYLKQKYGIPLVQGWKESTDPQKFVYEDIAIAAYLMVLWEEERERTRQKEKQSFVDLGCGNGLLVYLLQSEGHRGLGLDLRKRNIWDMFGPEINLQESIITPSDQHRFPDFDWLIGNHSDELTPWIPVMAARSSYKCRFFVLPCCPWDFDRKFSFKQKGLSVYQCYLDYIQQVGEACGFSVKQDVLRIPSTKRVCLIGDSRTYTQDEEEEADESRQSFINSHSQMTCDTPGVWSDGFQAREGSLLARNCARINWNIKQEIIMKVFTAVMQAEDADTKMLQDGRTWKAGGSVPLPELAALLRKDELQQLKAECGGLQTLLKNSSHIFRVQGGKVQLRQWDDDDECWRVRQHMKKKGTQKPDSNDLIKTKLCWFNDYHPNGCPRQAEHCYFAHGESDLRPLPEF